jgi:hypothetical protein
MRAYLFYAFKLRKGGNVVRGKDKDRDKDVSNSLKKFKEDKT